MRTVRNKLLLVVAACLIPAVLAAWLRAREAEGDLIDEIRSRLDLADEAFNGELKEDLSGIELTLSFVGSDPRLASDLQSGNTEGLRRLIDALGKGTEGAGIALADRKGRIVAQGGLAESALSEGSLPMLAAAAGGEHDHRFLPLKVETKQVYALTLAEPVFSNGVPVGALILARPIGSEFMEHARKLGSHWALSVNDKVVASSAGHPAPWISGSANATVEWIERGSRTYATNSFKPELLQGPGQRVVVTALQDVTELRREIRMDLFRSLGMLGVALLLAVGLALWIGRGMVVAISRIGAAAAGLKTGQYLTVQSLKTGDELEQLASAFNQAVEGLRERDQLKETFGKYVTRHVAERILAGKAVLGGEMVPVTVLFSDIRGFTSISEKMDPKALLDFLNIYFSGMVECVMNEAGVVDKFIGDAVMAVFGAPVPQEDDALRAVRAALAMRERLTSLNLGFAARGLPQIKIGIGVHSGMVVAGNMGHVERMEYTVIGDPVNLASRLESLTKELGVDILISEDTFLKVQAHVLVEPLREIQVRGREQAVKVYRLLDLRRVPVGSAA